MQNLNIKLNMLALKNAGVALLTGKSGNKKKCLIIPVDDNNMYIGQSGVYLSLVAWSTDKLQDGKTHLVKLSYTKELIDAMTDIEKKAIPIIGDIRTFGNLRENLGVQYQNEEGVSNFDDLPF